MNEVIIVAHPGDKFNNLVKISIEIAKLKSVSYCMFEFNGVKNFIKKDTTEEIAMREYLIKLKVNNQ